MAQVGFGNRVRVHGSEEVSTNACGAIYEINEGKRSEMQYHLVNEKIVYVLVGKVSLCVIKDGTLRKREFVQGDTIYVMPGLAHQFEAHVNSILVEFGTNRGAYAGDDLEDTFVIEKGSPAEQPANTSPSIVMSEEDKALVEESQKAAEELEVPAPKQTKKKRSRRKTREDN